MIYPVGFSVIIILWTNCKTRQRKTLTFGPPPLLLVPFNPQNGWMGILLRPALEYLKEPEVQAAPTGARSQTHHEALGSRGLAFSFRTF